MRTIAAITCLCVLLVILDGCVFEVSARGHGRKNRRDERSPNWKWTRDLHERDASGLPRWQRKLCKMGLNLGLPDFCDDDKDSHKDSQKSTTELEKLLREANKQNTRLKLEVQDKDRDLGKQQRMLIAKEQQCSRDEEQSKYFKSQFELKMQELERERTKCRKLQGKDDRTLAELKARARDTERVKAQLERVPQLQAEVRELEKTKAELETDLQEALERADMGCEEENDFSMLIFIVIMSLLPLCFVRAHFRGQDRFEHLQHQFEAKCAELATVQADLVAVQADFDSEFGDMMQINQSPPTLGTDFSYHISDERGDQGLKRSIKIQCPGVDYSDVEIDVIGNACVVKINRNAGQGVEAISWQKKFQFRPSEGVFEFKDEVTLDRGFLTLVFRESAFQNRTFRFPTHFDLSATDVDGSWDYARESAVGHDTVPSVCGTALGHPEMEASKPSQPAADPNAAPLPIVMEDAKISQPAANPNAAPLLVDMEHAKPSQPAADPNAAPLLDVVEDAKPSRPDADPNAAPLLDVMEDAKPLQPAADPNAAPLLDVMEDATPSRPAADPNAAPLLCVTKDVPSQPAVDPNAAPLLDVMEDAKPSQPAADPNTASHLEPADPCEAPPLEPAAEPTTPSPQDATSEGTDSDFEKVDFIPDM